MSQMRPSNGEPLPELPPVLRNKGFALIEKVGGGGFSNVYRASWTEKPNVDIAAKIIDLSENQVWVMKGLKNELKIIKGLEHPNVVRVYELIKTKNFAYIFMEFAKNGTVSDVMKRTGNPFAEPKAKKYMKDIINGLAFVHSKGIAHRDIKPDNFLIDHNEKAMLSDFGFACSSIAGTKLMKGTACGTREYMAPEIKLKKEGEVYDAMASDMYSYGVSLYCMVYFELPFDPRNAVECIRKQKNKEYKLNPRINVSNALKDLFDKLFDPNPRTRITSAMTQKHQWFTSMAMSSSASSSSV